MEWLSLPLKRYLTRTLQAKLSKYVNNVNLDKIGLLGSNIVLRDLELRLDVIQESLQIPLAFVLTRGFIKELRIQIPWTHLFSQPIKVTVANVEVIIVARSQQQYRQSKIRFGGSSERSTTGDKNGKDANDDLEAEDQGSWIQSMLTKVLGNAYVHVQNLVVKYEHANVMLSVSLGELKLFSTYTDDEESTPCFIEPNGARGAIYKKMTAKDITVSLDTSSEDNHEVPLLPRGRIEAGMLIFLDSHAVEEEEEEDGEAEAKGAAVHWFRQRALSKENDPFISDECAGAVTSSLSSQCACDVCTQAEAIPSPGTALIHQIGTRPDAAVVVVADACLDDFHLSLSDRQCVMLKDLWTLPSDAEAKPDEIASHFQPKSPRSANENSGRNVPGGDDENGSSGLLGWAWSTVMGDDNTTKDSLGAHA